MKILEDLKGRFTETQISEILEAARIALTDPEIREYILEKMDLTDDYGIGLGENIDIFLR